MRKTAKKFKLLDLRHPRRIPIERGEIISEGDRGTAHSHRPCANTECISDRHFLYLCYADSCKEHGSKQENKSRIHCSFHRFDSSNF